MMSDQKFALAIYGLGMVGGIVLKMIYDLVV